MPLQQQLFDVTGLRPHRVEGADASAVLALLKDHGVRFLRLQFSDVFGAAWGVDVPAPHFERALAGEVTFDGSTTEGFVRLEETELLLRPEPETLRIFPWGDPRGRLALLSCDVYRPDGTASEGDPRGALKRVLASLSGAGFQARIGAEIEFFLLRAGEVGDGAPLDPAPVEVAETARRDMVNVLEAMGIEVDAAHEEAAPGQHEIDLRPTDALTMADALLTLKFVVNRIAPPHGLRASFMPKPVFGWNGSGLYLHQTLLRDGRNAFSNPEVSDGISDTLRFYVGGLLRHAGGYCAVTNPLVNSYKRLVRGYDAPVVVAWSLQNRAPLVRVPAGRGEEMRCELLLPDPSANPYLALAALLGSGLDGVQGEIHPGEPLNKNLESLSPRERQRLKILELPRDLGAALDELEQDRVVRAALGEHIYSHFVDAKRREWHEYNAQIHPWERDRYL